MAIEMLVQLLCYALICITEKYFKQCFIYSQFLAKINMKLQHSAWFQSIPLYLISLSVNDCIHILLVAIANNARCFVTCLCASISRKLIFYFSAGMIQLGIQKHNESNFWFMIYLWCSSGSDLPFMNYHKCVKMCNC